MNWTTTYFVSTLQHIIHLFHLKTWKALRKRTFVLFEYCSKYGLFESKSIFLCHLCEESAKLWNKFLLDAENVKIITMFMHRAYKKASTGGATIVEETWGPKKKAQEIKREAKEHKCLSILYSRNAPAPNFGCVGVRVPKSSLQKMSEDLLTIAKIPVGTSSTIHNFDLKTLRELFYLMQFKVFTELALSFPGSGKTC